MSGKRTGRTARNLTLGLVLLVLAGCRGFDPRSEGALDQYTAQEIFTRGEVELEPLDDQVERRNHDKALELALHNAGEATVLQPAQLARGVDS